MKSVLLADIDSLTRAESFAKTTKMFASDTLVVFLAAGVVCALITAILLYRRNRRRRVVGGEKVFRPNSLSVAEAEAEEERRRYKKRVRRREHRHRNPTLAETGGFPEPPTQPGNDAR